MSKGFLILAVELVEREREEEVRKKREGGVLVEVRREWEGRGTGKGP